MRRPPRLPCPPNTAGPHPGPPPRGRWRCRDDAVAVPSAAATGRFRRGTRAFRRPDAVAPGPAARATCADDGHDLPPAELAGTVHRADELGDERGRRPGVTARRARRPAQAAGAHDADPVGHGQRLRPGPCVTPGWWCEALLQGAIARASAPDLRVEGESGSSSISRAASTASARSRATRLLLGRREQLVRLLPAWAAMADHSASLGGRGPRRAAPPTLRSAARRRRVQPFMFGNSE